MSNDISNVICAPSAPSATDTADEVEQWCDQLCTNYAELHVAAVDRLNSIPTPLDFYRKYLSPNRPLLLTSNTCRWPCITDTNRRWSVEFLRHVLGDTVISACVTPNGYADAVISNTSNHTGYFVEPHNISLPFSEFINLMHNTAAAQTSQHYIPNAVYYIQQQNNSFTQEYHQLHNDIAQHDFIADALDTPHDVCNLWLGGMKSVTAIHRDNYENVYTVVSGSKTFYLLPPVTEFYLQYNQYASAMYMPKHHAVSSGADYIDLTGDVYSDWCIVPTGKTIPWSTYSASKYDPAVHSHHLEPLRVTVHPGETLYLPSMWFHEVLQIDDTIAVNYWYDMSYGIQYCYNEFMRSVINSRHQQQQPKLLNER